MSSRTSIPTNQNNNIPAFADRIVSKPYEPHFSLEPDSLFSKSSANNFENNETPLPLFANHPDFADSTTVVDKEEWVRLLLFIDAMNGSLANGAYQGIEEGQQDIRWILDDHNKTAITHLISTARPYLNKDHIENFITDLSEKNLLNLYKNHAYKNLSEADHQTIAALFALREGLFLLALENKSQAIQTYKAEWGLFYSQLNYLGHQAMLTDTGFADLYDLLQENSFSTPESPTLTSEKLTTPTLELHSTQETIQEFYAESEDGRFIHCQLYLPSATQLEALIESKGDTGLTIFSHGYCENKQGRTLEAQTLCSQGYFALNISQLGFTDSSKNPLEDPLNPQTPPIWAEGGNSASSLDFLFPFMELFKKLEPTLATINELRESIAKKDMPPLPTVFSVHSASDYLITGGFLALLNDFEKISANNTLTPADDTWQSNKQERLDEIDAKINNLNTSFRKRRTKMELARLTQENQRYAALLDNPTLAQTYKILHEQMNFQHLLRIAPMQRLSPLMALNFNPIAHSKRLPNSLTLKDFKLEKFMGTIYNNEEATFKGPQFEAAEINAGLGPVSIRTALAYMRENEYDLLETKKGSREYLKNHHINVTWFMTVQDLIVSTRAALKEAALEEDMGIQTKVVLFTNQKENEQKETETLFNTNYEEGTLNLRQKLRFSFYEDIEDKTLVKQKSGHMIQWDNAEIIHAATIDALQQSDDGLENS